QAEDGIRDDLVTGVQTCALPIFPHNRTSKCRTPLCFAELCRASCSTRKKEREMSGDKGLAKSWVWKSIFAFCCSPNSWQKPLIAAAIPKYCSFAACNSCDKD